MQRKPSADEPFCGLVFKILAAKTGDLYWIRVYSGTLESNSRVYNPEPRQEGECRAALADPCHEKGAAGQVESSECGDIVVRHRPALRRLPATRCAIHATSSNCRAIQFAQTVISMAIEPENTAERKKLAEVLEMLKRQDPTFNASENDESAQTLISGMGELHLDVIKHRLTARFQSECQVLQAARQLSRNDRRGRGSRRPMQSADWCHADVCSIACAF